MTSPHLTERDLQTAAEAVSPLASPHAAHLHGCSLCRGRVATYQQLFTAAAQLPAPVFAFDLSARVLAQLPRPRPAFPWVLAGVAALVLGVVGAFVALFGSVLAPVLQSFSSGLGAGLGAVAGCLVAGQCLALVARHRQQMRLLAFS